MPEKKRDLAGNRPHPRKGNLAGEVADRLRGDILRGEYPVGRPLRELELCRRLGVSRVPLREALHRLEGEGLVRIRPNRGAEVAHPSRAELLEIAEACRLIEGHLLALAAPLLTGEQLGQAEELVARMDGEQDVLTWRRLNWEFHAHLYGPAQRPLLVEWVGALRGRAELAMLILVADPGRRHALNQEHRRILEALRARRTDLALRTLVAHLEGGKEKILGLLPES
jgi:DNA-binding GntR family transcriptional regulator